MSILTYKTLFSQVDELVNKRLRFTTTSAHTDQLDRVSVAPMVTNRTADISVGELVEAVQTMLKDSLPNRIISGLNVTQTDPISDSVIITSGKGVASGVLYELGANTTIKIPFDSTTSVFYINLYLDRILIEKGINSEKLSIAKIIIPEPGTTNRVKNLRDDDYEWDAYIVNLREYTLHTDANDNLEEDSKDFLKDNLINPLLASNLIGTINLNENLKISNTQGSVNIDSKEIDIKDTSGNILAKLNRRGTFFYDTSGRELARFSSDDARVGNILITKNTIESDDFVSGSSGFRIQDNGNAEFNTGNFRGNITGASGTFSGAISASSGAIGGWSITDTTLTSNTLRLDSANHRIETTNFVSGDSGTGWRIDSNTAEFQNIRARGKITSSVFEKNTISGLGGSFFVLDSDVLDADMTAIGSTITITGDMTLRIGDVLRIKDGTNDEWLEVTNITNAPTYTVSRDQKGDYISGVNCPTWKKGTAVVKYGLNGEGGIFMTSSESNSPYIDFFTHNGNPWSTINYKTRIGKLDGIAGAMGYGIWAGSGYLGQLEVVNTISIGATGSIRSNLQGSYPYLEFSNSGLQLKNSDAGGTYGSGVYSTAKYGYGALAWIMNADLGIPFAELKEPTASGNTVPTFRFFNRSSNPTGGAEMGDIANVLGYLKQCVIAGTPGTFETFTTSDGATGGAGSAGAGNQYLAIRVGGTVYKLLHDGTL